MNTKKTIAIDVSMLVYDGSGVANYTYNLCKNLLKYAPEYQYKFFYSSRRVPPETVKKLHQLESLGARVYKYKFPPWLLSIVWNKLNILPVNYLIGSFDVYHSSDYLRPPLPKKSVALTTIHDLTWKKFPEFHTSDIIVKHERKLIKTIKYNDHIITDSENTKIDLINYYPQLKEKNNKVHVLYLGIGEIYKPIKPSQYEDVLKKYHVNSETNFLLYIGAIEPRKNLVKAIEVFYELIKDPKYINYKFYFIGRAGWKNSEVFETIQKLGLQKSVVHLGYIPDEDIPSFYSASKCFIYLSKYEGFGLPPLEALACGTKVIASDNSSLKEILNGEYLTSIDSTQTILSHLKSILELKNPIHNIFTPSWKDYIEKFIAIIKKHEK